MRYNVQTCPSPGGGRLQARTMSSSCWANTDLSAGELLFALTTPAVIDVVTQNRLTLAVKRVQYRATDVIHPVQKKFPVLVWCCVGIYSDVLDQKGRSRSRQSSTSSTTTESRTCLALVASYMTITHCRPITGHSLQRSQISTYARKMIVIWRHF
ncbi:hypothetical protein CEXT_124761 [Caerostris extrusa]|uniref:Uncharacterized protein n=1 Tax=Caerostris extrusa TaxID=172846 RepID=A0AAV4QRW9_CAEEX|nr:hypothetical protein CEXT_124761 [Caerostris extrusa]